jgi:sodium-dependent dicarboxylate transporter 2/3/5
MHCCCRLQAGKCAYVVLIMAVYWVAEVIPLAATALIPIALVPLLGIQPSQAVCINYLKAGTPA